jgi:hypothetical protein
MNLNFLKKKNQFRKKGIDIKPDLYWMYILSLTFILILLAFIFGLYLFININKEMVLPVANIEKDSALKKERFKKVLEYFDQREIKSIEILNSPSPIVDPSL